MKRLMRLFVILFALMIAGCTGAPEQEANTGRPSDIQIVVPGADFTIGRPRIPFVLYSGLDKVADAQHVALTASILEEEGAGAGPQWSGEATAYNDYETPYWVAYPELDEAGFWGFTADIMQADGSRATSQFTIQVTEQSESPLVGERPPASYNRTLATEPELKRLTSSVEPESGLYQTTVAEAMVSGRPTVVTFATPAFCTSQLCAPVVESVAQVYRRMGTAANFIHIEVYKSFDPLVLADEMTGWGLASEPWTFVLDKDGVVAAKLAGPVSPQELTDLLNPLLP